MVVYAIGVLYSSGRCIAL